MKVARPATRLASLVSLVLVAALAHADGATRAARPTERPPGVPSPAQSWIGLWRAEAGPPATLTITARGSSLLYVFAGNGFEATGFADGNTVVAVTRMAPRPDDPHLDHDLGILRLERLDPSTLRARYFTDLHGAPTHEETWKRAPERATPPDAAIVDPNPVDPDLPKFGEYVYVEELPEAVTKVAAVYPDDARRAGVEGRVMVQVLIGKDGHVKDARVVISSPLLDEAAVASVRQWVFKPALSNNKPIACWYAIPVKFSLH